MNPELAKQVAVVLGWLRTTVSDFHGNDVVEWLNSDGRTLSEYDLPFWFSNLNILLPEVARWCVANGAHIFDIEKETYSAADLTWLARISIGNDNCFGESDDPATALCLALVEADKKLKGDNNERN